eukprot:TRINITY_DN472_c0_g1_i1.p1 TRINITY_DN472_c0_g1~~TRINITY_DN472_c0_g1_i1.p1  ORF type:complete len:192 (-),score=32.59 TRINITY_DN472_c0_g1_i1:87-626(-)
MGKDKHHHHDDGEFVEGTEEWDVDLLETCFKVPHWWCLSCLCPCCMAYHQRIRIYENDLDNRYVCFGGAYGEFCVDTCRKCAPVALCCEVSCCLGAAIAGNRYLIKRAYNVKNTWLENMILLCACICSWVICILRIFCDNPLLDKLGRIFDLLMMLLSACLLSQAENELDKRMGPISVV